MAPPSSRGAESSRISATGSGSGVNTSWPARKSARSSGAVSVHRAPLRPAAPSRELAWHRDRAPSPLLIHRCPTGYCSDHTAQCARCSFARQPSYRRRKAPAGEDRGFCGLSVCRSNRPMCIVGGHNDATNRMRPFYLNCNSYSGKLTTNCANPYARLSSRRISLGTWPTMRPS